MEESVVGIVGVHASEEEVGLIEVTTLLVGPELEIE